MKSLLKICCLICLPGSVSVFAQTEEILEPIPDPVQTVTFCGQEYDETYWDDPDLTAGFPGGRDSMRAYIVSQLDYSKKTWKKFRDQYIYLTLDINKEGKVVKVYIDRPEVPELSEEIKKACLSMPNWMPAQNTRIRKEWDQPISDEEPGINYVNICNSWLVNSKQRISFFLPKPKQ